MLQYLASVLDAATACAVIATDPSGSIELWSAGAEALYGSGASEMLGRPMDVLCAPPDRAAELAREMRTAARDRGTWSGIVERRRRDGSTAPTSIVLTPRHGADRALAGYVLVAHGHAESVARRTSDTDTPLRAENRRLLAASHAKDRFLASMSHELRTPLNAILGYVGTLLLQIPGPLNDEQRRQLETVRTNSRHLLSLLNDLLDLARIQAGRMDVQLCEIDCRELLEGIALGLRPLASAKRLELTVDGPAGTTVVSDRRALTQILINLASNAIKFTDQGSVVLRFIPAAAGQCGGRFAVCDTGRGIRRTDRARLFEAFESIGGSGEVVYEGTGLGLHICAQLAAALHASIDVESRVGVGSTFTVSIGEQPTAR